MQLRVATFLVCVLLCCGTGLRAGDWPQILGPRRNGAAENESLATQWPENGPPTNWQRDVGSGYAGVAVTNGKAVLFHRVGDREVVEAMDARTGDRLWKADYPARYVPSFTDDSGPRVVPVIHEGKVYVYGSLGGLRAIDLADGKKLWERETFDEYVSKRAKGGEPPEGYFGIGTSPIVEDGKLIVNVGGEAKQAGVVAFELATGKTAWTATGERASYSSPLAVTIGGKRHLIFITRFSVVSLDPANGDLRFKFAFGRPGPNVSAANPVVVGDRLFVSASYGFGAVLARVGEKNADVLWSGDDLMSSQYTTCVEEGGLLWGIHGRQDGAPATLRCFDPKTQEVKWSQDEFGYATLIKADGKLVILKTDGELVLAALDAERYRELSRASILAGETRALPALANGLLYARNGRTLKCVDIGKRQ